MEQVVVELGSSHQSIIVRAGAIKASLKDARLLVQRFAEELDGLFEAGFDKKDKKRSIIFLICFVKRFRLAMERSVRFSSL